MYSPKTTRYAVFAALIGLLAIAGLLLIGYQTQPPQTAAAHHATHTESTFPDPASAEPIHTAAPADHTATPTDTPQAGWPRHITDARGTTTTLARPPQRIISLAPSVTQILRAIGAEGALVAIPREGSDPSEAESLVRLSVYPTPSPEAVLSLRPDLLIGADITSPAVAGRLRSLGLPVIILSGSAYNDIVADIDRAGTATGLEATSAILADALTALRNTVEAEVNAALSPAPPSPTSSAASATATQTPAAANTTTLPAQPPSAPAAATQSPRPRALLFIGQSPDYVAGSGSYASDLLKIAGADNLALKLNQPWPQLSREFILEANPELLIFTVSEPMPSAPPDAPGRSRELTAYLQSDPIWSQLDAVRNNRVYAINQSLLNVPGPHIGETLLQLRAIVRDAQALLATPSTS